MEEELRRREYEKRVDQLFDFMMCSRGFLRTLQKEQAIESMNEYRLTQYRERETAMCELSNYVRDKNNIEDTQHIEKLDELTQRYKQAHVNYLKAVARVDDTKAFWEKKEKNNIYF